MQAQLKVNVLSDPSSALCTRGDGCCISPLGSQETESTQEKLLQSLECSICVELFVRAITLACSHSFCQDCLASWIEGQTQARSVPVCPMCRQPIVAAPQRTIALDQTIELLMLRRPQLEQACGTVVLLVVIFPCVSFFAFSFNLGPCLSVSFVRHIHFSRSQTSVPFFF